MKTQVLIIGGGATGTGLARDLALRGIQSILVEKSDINAGASGGNHGLLHSGGRYVGSDPEAAIECMEEGELLKRLASHCIEDTGGLFVAVKGDDENYIADFPDLCAACGITAKPLDIQEARSLEPSLSENIIAAYAVPDAAIDPFMLSLDNITQAQSMGCCLFRFCKVVDFTIKRSRIESVKLMNTQTGDETWVEADLIVNAAGAWAGHVAKLAGIKINILYSKGSLVITHSRIARRVINRMRPASNADILVPGGTVSILGTTSIRIDDPDEAFPTVEEIDMMVEDAAAMIPALEEARYIRAYCGVRPLFQGDDSDEEKVNNDRSVSRGFALIDHGKHGVENFITITGGKLTTYRLMAEKTADLICKHLGVSQPGLTKSEPLPPTQRGCWTEPAFAPKIWLKQHDLKDILLCECEMVPKSAVDSITDSIRNQSGHIDLSSIGLRSRIGKGPCQGTFCGPRITSYLFDKGEIGADQCLEGLRQFLGRRWAGQQSILWGGQLKQAELIEAMHCGLFGLELNK